MKKAKLVLSILLCIVFCPIVYFVYKFNVIHSFDLVMVWLPTPIASGALLCLYLYLINELRLKPLWVSAFFFSGALGGIGYHIIEQQQMTEYYPLFPELSLVFAGFLCLIIAFVYFTVKHRNEVRRNYSLIMQNINKN